MIDAGLFIFLVLFGFILAGMPIAFSLAMSSVLTILVYETVSITFAAKSIVTALNSYPLLAVPLFILSGELMFVGGLSKRLTKAIHSFFGWLKASLAYVTVLASTFFGAISGSSPATVAAIGTIMVPEMKQRGYPEPFSASLIAASGMIGVMIPPSIPFVMYGVASETSIDKLFIAGIIPGLLFAAGFIATSRVIYAVQMVPAEMTAFNFKQAAKDLADSFWALLTPVIILGGIYGGIFSPTEAATVSVFYALIVGVFIYKELTVKKIFESFSNATKTIGMVLALVAFASTFGRILTLEQVPQNLAHLVATISENKIIILLLINVFLLIVGMFFETIAAIVILTPILLPIVKQFDINPVHFGAILTVNLAIGFCTPPFGINLFVSAGVTGLSIEKISRSIVPYFITMAVLLLLITLFPTISLLLPNMYSQ